MVMSSPKKRMVPEDGGKSPVMQLNSVVLPAPLEPSTARRSPGRTVKVTSVSAASAPNMPRHAAQFQRGAGADGRQALRDAIHVLWPLRPDRGSRTVRGAPRSHSPTTPSGRPEHDGEEAEADQQPEAIAVEPDLDQESSAKVRRITKINAPMKGPIGRRDAADDGDDQNVDAGSDADRAGRDLPVVPDLQDAAERRDERRERIGRDAMRVDVEAERGHAAGIVAHALQSEAERRAGEIAGRRNSTARRRTSVT